MAEGTLDQLVMKKEAAFELKFSIKPMLTHVNVIQKTGLVMMDLSFRNRITSIKINWLTDDFFELIQLSVYGENKVI